MNVVDLTTLQPRSQHPRSLTDSDFDALFPVGVPVIFAFHGYPALIHRLIYKRANHDAVHVRGFMKEGTTTTPFDMLVRNRLDRFHLVADVVRRFAGRAAYMKQAMRDKLIEHAHNIVRHSTDVPAISG